MTSTSDFPVAGIGASAGGVEALEGFFRGVPDTPGLAFVVVTHLARDRESMLHDIVRRYTSMPVRVIEDGTPVEVDHIYVMGSDALLAIEEGVLRLTPQDPMRRERRPIDRFFGSLALDRNELAAGVVLSGGDHDGTLGIKAIKERGGLTLAQTADGFGPGHPDMPESAISSGLVDFAVPVEEMGGKLVEFARGLSSLDDVIRNPERETERQQLDDTRREIYGILRKQVGHDFSGYKVKTFVRRVQRRMQVLQIETPQAYLDRLRDDPQEVSALFRDLLINVTSFFRDPEAFDGLAAQVVPKLFEQRGPDEPVRVWVPGCATGEEVYSIAILLREYMDRAGGTRRAQIFATDIDERALMVARAARYPETLLEGVSAERRSRFFVPDGGSYLVAKEIRDMCIFSPHSVIRDPPFSRIDLVSCRNLLIYFGTEVQNQVIPTFYYALRPDGFLFLGTSENVTQFEELFAPIDKKCRIFRRKTDIAPQVRLPVMVSAMRAGNLSDFTPTRSPIGGIALRQLVDSQMLERFTPPHVLVTSSGDVIYYSGRTGKYLEAAPGVPTRQMLTMARKGLGLDLRAAFREAVESGRAATRDGVAVEADDGRVQLISLTVEPLIERTGGEPMYLVVFTDQGPVLSRDEALARAQATHNGTAHQAEQELRDTRERLQSMIEEYETALEELKSSNEELVSVNEELQSSNEELEASKEELVSVNEELHTVNAELNGKIEALDRANSDLQNLFESTSVATVFLDSRLVIRSFTPAMARIYSIRPSDCGRPITDLATRFKLDAFEDDIYKVLESQIVLERRISSLDNTQHYLVRLAPYRNGHRQADGVVVSFVDVTGMVHAEERQTMLIGELQHRTRNLLSVVQSIAQQTFDAGEALATFLDRLAALGRLQGLLGEAQGELVDLTDIVRLEFETLGVSDGGQLSVAGPPVPLGFSGVQTVALVLHELATNAVKYGALKEPDAKLEIRWGLEERDARGTCLVLDWKESGVSVAPDSSKQGFGRKLIEKALTFTLRAKTDLVFNRDGIACHIEIPLASLSARSGEPAEATSHEGAT
ncbi:two-component system, chemotaxis family, CheB/CheR fusion protein [Paraburkholderia kururiensis]|uniref:CheR family methyltransferase n=1 Tax=Paraburkholderia kururiensis TaxID=984307 RepID=UPI0039A6F323